MPRTGLPPRFASYSEYERAVGTIMDAGIVEDASKFWWDVRPSVAFPTVESRICDVMPRLRDAIGLTALTQSLFAMLHDLGRKNQRWREYDRFLIEENRWRAQRYGASAGLLDFGLGRITPFAETLEELIALVSPYAETLGCLSEVEGLRAILAEGTSAQRQTAVFRDATDNGMERPDALRAVVRSLVEDFSADL